VGKDRIRPSTVGSAAEDSPGTQSGHEAAAAREGRAFRLRRTGVRGDEIVEITVTVPMPRDERTKELLKELAKLKSGRSAGGIVE